MTNTTSNIEIQTVSTSNFSNTVVLISEKPVIGGGINQTALENTIYDANLIYEF